MTEVMGAYPAYLCIKVMKSTMPGPMAPPGRSGSFYIGTHGMCDKFHLLKNLRVGGGGGVFRVLRYNILPTLQLLTGV